MPGTFKCTRCGQCCTDFLQRSKEDQAPPDPYIVDLVPTGTIGVTIFPWEVDPLLAGARQRQLSVRIIPSLGILNRPQKVVLVLNYFLYHARCPFLSTTNTCHIYQDRPLACRSFPVRASGLLFGHFDAGRCPQAFNPFGKHALELDVGVEMHAFYKAYGESYLSCLKTELIDDMLFAFITQLRQQGILQLAPNPKKSERAQLRDYQWQDLFKFLGLPRNPLTIRQKDAACVGVLGSDRHPWTIRPNPLSYIQKIYRMPFDQVRDLVTHIFIGRKMAPQLAQRGQRLAIMYDGKEGIVRSILVQDDRVPPFK